MCINIYIIIIISIWPNQPILAESDEGICLKGNLDHILFRLVFLLIWSIEAEGFTADEVLSLILLFFRRPTSEAELFPVASPEGHKINLTAAPCCCCFCCCVWAGLNLFRLVETCSLVPHWHSFFIFVLDFGHGHRSMIWLMVIGTGHCCDFEHICLNSVPVWLERRYGSGGIGAGRYGGAQRRHAGEA